MSAQLTNDILDEIFVQKTYLLGYDETQTTDQSLAVLAVGLGHLSEVVAGKGTILKPHLQRIAGFAAGWAMRLASSSEDICHAIIAERKRQEELFCGRKFNFTCASLTADSFRKLRVLLEEVGEVAQECDALEYAKRIDMRLTITKRLVTELVQVAAVCVAWLESLEVKS